MAINIKQGNTPNMEFSNTSSGRTLKHKIVYYTDDTSDGVEYRMGTWEGIPQKGDAYPYDSSLVVSSVTCRPIEDSDDSGDFIWWHAEIAYTPIADDPDSTTDHWEDVADRVTWGGNQYEIIVDSAYAVNNVLKEKDGLPIGSVESTTGESIPATKIISNGYVTIATNQADFNPDWISEYSNTVLSKSMRIAGTQVKDGTARIMRISASNQIDGSGDSYYEVTIEIEINREGFNFRPQNRGFYMADPADSKKRILIRKKDISNETGDVGEERIEEPWKLDKDSKVILDDTAYYLDFRIMKKSPWSSLPIPSNF